MHQLYTFYTAIHLILSLKRRTTLHQDKIAHPSVPIIWRVPLYIVSLSNSPILPTFMPALAKALSADCAPGPGVFVLYNTKKM